MLHASDIITVCRMLHWKRRRDTDRLRRESEPKREVYERVADKTDSD